MPHFRPLAQPCRRAAALLIGVALWGAPALADDLVKAVTTPGRAELRVCRSWLMYNSCNEYGHVDVPPRIAVGDTIYLDFGSNPKTMAFRVGRIHFVNGVCRLYTGATASEADDENADRVTIDPCRQPPP
jgi:hypothetical protein